MFIIKWWRFCRGYLIISLKGRGVERLLNLAIARGIGFWDLQKQQAGARLSVHLSSFRALRPLIRQTRCRLHILRKVGLPFWKHRLRRRWGLLVGLLIFLTTIYTATSMIWFIQVTGIKELDEAVVMDMAGQLGIRPGVFKRTLDLQELEEELARMHGDIVWAGIRVRGTLIEIEIVEHVPEPVIDNRPADLVAAKDGLVERVLVLDGEAMVAPGDTVSRGDLLIEGVVTGPEAALPEDEQPPLQEVRARGEVEARVWYEARVAISERQIVPKETGQSRVDWRLCWPGRSIRFWGPAASPYDHSVQEIMKWSLKWRNLDLPVELIKSTYHEILFEEKIISPAEALQIAKDTALEELLQQIPGDVRVEELLFQEYTEQGRRWVRAVAETREDIAEIKLRWP